MLEAGHQAEERLDDKSREKLRGLLRAGDPNGDDVATVWQAKEPFAGSMPTVILTSPSCG